MSLPDRTLTFVRALAAIGIAALAAGCFQPMYGERLSGGPANGESAMALALASVDVPEIDTPQGQRISRISVELRNDLIFALTGGRGTTSPTHRLKVILNGSGIPVIVDINSGRTEIFNYRLTATYVLTDLATGRPVVRGSATGEVSYNIPG
ncbi:MAG: hypothetical protein JO245_13660, partial [Pseudolabrys sp.]|nr:hypothetical protein [Pseudolabrys sp.]